MDEKKKRWNDHRELERLKNWWNVCLICFLLININSSLFVYLYASYLSAFEVLHNWICSYKNYSGTKFRRLAGPKIHKIIKDFIRSKTYIFHTLTSLKSGWYFSLEGSSVLPERICSSPGALSSCNLFKLSAWRFCTYTENLDYKLAWIPVYGSNFQKKKFLTQCQD